MIFWIFLFSYFVSHSWGIPMMKITGLSHLFKWENLHNWWLTKYFFAPLYIVIKYFRTPVFIGYGFSWRDASLWPHRRTYRKRLLKKGRKTTVMSYTIKTIEVSFINVSVLSLSNLGSINKSHHLAHTWLWEISKDLNFLIYANTASPLRFIFLTWAYKKTENVYGGYNILALQGTTVMWISRLYIFIYISILKSTGKLVTYF